MYQAVFHIMLAGALATSAPPPAPAAGQAIDAPAAAGPVSSGQAAPPATVAQVSAPAGEPSEQLGARVALDQLAVSRGGSEGVASHSELGGTVGSNSASQLTTGANSIATGSLAGAVGLPVVIQNSGANVLIQNSTIVNVQFK